MQESLRQPWVASTAYAKRRGPKTWFPYLVLTPMMVWFVGFVLFPILYSIWTSLHLWVAENPALSTFVGFQNYVDLLTNNPRFVTSFSNTFKYAIFVTLICVPLGFLLAIPLSKVARLNRFYTFAFFLPSLVPASIIGIVFVFFYQPTFGTFNYLLGKLGIPMINFLKDSNIAIFAIGGAEIWQRLGFVVLICYTGLLELPPALLEAARIDGANGRQVLFYITLPLMRRVLLFVTVVTVIGALQAFDLIYGMTFNNGGGLGGPGDSTYTLGLYVFNEGLGRFRFGTAGAASTILFIIIFIATLMQFRFFRSRWEY